AGEHGAPDRDGAVLAQLEAAAAHARFHDHLVETVLGPGVVPRPPASDPVREDREGALRGSVHRPAEAEQLARLAGAARLAPLLPEKPTQHQSYAGSIVSDARLEKRVTVSSNCRRTVPVGP